LFSFIFFVIPIVMGVRWCLLTSWGFELYLLDGYWCTASLSYTCWPCLCLLEKCLLRSISHFKLSFFAVKYFWFPLIIYILASCLVNLWKCIF
jgi:hypothetical protein